MFLEKLFRGFSPPIFLVLYSCEYKKRFFALFSDDFFPNSFVSHYSWICGNIVSRVFPPIFDHGIHSNIKNAFSHFYPKIFFPNIFWSHYSCVSGKIVSVFFFPPFFGTIFVRIKKTLFSTFSRRFFPQHFMVAQFFCLRKNCLPRSFLIYCGHSNFRI